jgi:hypothetical protein
VTRWWRPSQPPCARFRRPMRGPSFCIVAIASRQTVINGFALSYRG